MQTDKNIQSFATGCPAIPSYIVTCVSVHACTWPLMSGSLQSSHQAARKCLFGGIKRLRASYWSRNNELVLWVLTSIWRDLPSNRPQHWGSLWRVRDQVGEEIPIVYAKNVWAPLEWPEQVNINCWQFKLVRRNLIPAFGTHYLSRNELVLPTKKIERGVSWGLQVTTALGSIATQFNCWRFFKRRTRCCWTNQNTFRYVCKY